MDELSTPICQYLPTSLARAGRLLFCRAPSPNKGSLSRMVESRVMLVAKNQLQRRYPTAAVITTVIAAAGLVALCALLAVSYSPRFAVAVLSPPSPGPHAVVEGRHPAPALRSGALVYDTQDGLWLRTDGKDRCLVAAKNGLVVEGAVSPDGTKLAYVRHEAGSEGIYLYNLQTGSDNPIAAAKSPFIYMHPEWSPDGDQLCLTRMGPSSDLSRGNEVEYSIWILTLGMPSLEYVTSGRDATWSPDGTHLVVQRPGERVRIPRVDAPESDDDYTDLLRYDLWIVDIASRTARLLTSGAEPAWSPDGRHIAFTDYRVVTVPTTRVLRELWVLDTATGTRHRLTDALKPLAPGSCMQALPVTTDVVDYRGTTDFGLHADYEPAWSCSPQGLYFASYLRESGVFYIYLLPFSR